MAKKKVPWTMLPDDVLVGGSSAMVARKSPGKHSRARQETEGTISLTHRPTGVSVEAAYSATDLSKRAAGAIRKKLVDELYPKLEAEVARFLRVPGR